MLMLTCALPFPGGGIGCRGHDLACTSFIKGMAAILVRARGICGASA
jgi:hypothetical protein